MYFISIVYQFILQLTMSFLRLSDKQNQSKNLKTRSSKYEDIFIYTLIDKCTQILRQDRVLIRNKIKHGDKDALAVFSNLQKPINMHLLQINIRKYLTQAKMASSYPIKQNQFQTAYKINRENIMRKSIDPSKSLQRNLHKSKSPSQKELKFCLTQLKLGNKQQKQINQTQKKRRTHSQSNNNIKFMEKDNCKHSRNKNDGSLRNLFSSDLYKLQNNFQTSKKQLCKSNDRTFKNNKITSSESKIPDCRITQSIITTHDGIFTSPELLMECRKFLQHTKNQTLRSDTNVSAILQIQDKSEKQKKSFTNLKIQQTKSKILENENQRPHEQVNDTKTQLTTQELSSNKTIKKLFRDYKAEQVFELIFHPKSKFEIDWQSFDRIISQNFQVNQNQFIQDLFLHLRSTQNKINAIQIGKCLDKALCRKNTSIEYIYNLIDIQQHGNFTQEEFERFLSQIMQIQSQNFEEIKITAAKIFKAADLQKTKKINYWGLYFIRDIPQVISFAEYLEQFQFQVEM